MNRWTALPSSVATLDGATNGHRERSLVWRELLARYGVGDVASVVFPDRFGCWGFLELWRQADVGAFGDEDVRLLQALADPLTGALRSRAAASLAPPTAAAGAYNVAAQLLAVEAGVDDAAPTARAHLAGGRWVTFRATRIGTTEPPDRRDIAVTIEVTDPIGRVDLLARACGLSGRERQVLDHLVLGRDTAEVARQMFGAPTTVQDHLKSVFDKTGVRSRRTLLARALGTLADDGST